MKRLHPGAVEGRASGCGLADCDMGQAGTAGPDADDHIPGFAAHVKDLRLGAVHMNDCIRPDSIVSISYDCMASMRIREMGFED